MAPSGGPPQRGTGQHRSRHDGRVPAPAGPGAGAGARGRGPAGRLRVRHAPSARPAQADTGGADQGATVSEPARDHPGTPRELQAARPVHLGLGRGEERIAEPERHRSAHDGERQVEEVDHRRQGPADQHPGARHDDGGGQPRRLARDRGQGRPGRLRLEAAAGAAVADAPRGLDDHVADVARVAQPPPEQPAVEHDAASHARRHDHRDVIATARRRPHPALTESERLGVVGNERGQPGQLRQAGAQGERPPGLDVERRHLVAARAHRPAASRPAHDHPVPGAGGATHALDQRGQVAPQHLGRSGPVGVLAVAGAPLRGRPRPGGLHRPFDQGSVQRDEPGRHLGAADVDGQNEVCHGPGTTSSSSSWDAAAQPGRAQLGGMLSPRAGGSGTGTSRAPRSRRPRYRSTPRQTSPARRLSPG